MFRVLSVFAAGILAALSLLLLVNAGLYIERYSVGADPGADFLGRRASPMFLGLALLLWLGRDLSVGAARDMICLTMATTWAGIALTGLYEFAIGTAQATIVMAAIVELAIGGGFLVARKR